jgi:hypothetical protein
MTSTAINLSSSASPQEVLAAAQRTLEERGYLWEPHGQLAAVAHQGGAQLKSNLAKTKWLLLALNVEDGQLNLHRLRYRWAWLVAAGGLVPASVNNEFQHVSDDVIRALQDAQLIA